jgi:predicted Zn-dependent protease
MPTDWQPIINDFKAVVPRVDFWSLRLVHDETETLQVRDDVVQPPSLVQSRGVHISFMDRGGMAYAATSALNREGLRAACEEAFNWLAFSRRRCASGSARPGWRRPHSRG